MSETVKLRISPAVAPFVRPGVAAGERMHGLKAAEGLDPVDRVVLLFCLTRDQDPQVRNAAIPAFNAVADEDLFAYCAHPDPHPAILDCFVRSHASHPGVAQVLLDCERLSSAARTFLEGQHPPQGEIGSDSLTADHDQSTDSHCPDEAEEDADEPEPESEEYLSKFRMAQVMGIGEKIKMALTGDKEWRSILIKDANKLVSGSVVKNPRITDGEILTILKVGVQNDEIIRTICANKEWVKNYRIRKALVDCPKTPVANSLRFLASLDIKDIAGYAKSKNISSVLSTQAKRILLAKKR